MYWEINLICKAYMWTSFTTLIDVDISLTKKYYGQNLENCRYLHILCKKSQRLHCNNYSVKTHQIHTKLVV